MEECIVCFEEREPIAFPCGHKVCAVCYPKLKRCPLCNYEVITITPRVSRVYVEMRPYSPESDTRILQFVCCFILLGIIIMALYRWP